MIAVLANALVSAFVLCCIASAGLQIVAWTRHSRGTAPMGIRALWRPEGHFDDIGLRQILLARRLLLVGGVAYLSYGALLVASAILGSIQ